MVSRKREGTISYHRKDSYLRVSQATATDDQYVCYYLDHTFVDPKKLALLSSRIKQNSLDHFKDALLVCTCHRIEVYFSCPPQKDPIEAVLGIKARRIKKKFELENRLIKICCGVKSIILGEKFIYHQVSQAVNSLPSGHIMQQFGNTVLKKARQIRENRNFYAADDYEGLSLSLINKWADCKQDNTLVVVGAGMLSLQVAMYASANNYENVVMVSRVAKKFRKKNRENPYPFRICSLYTLPETIFDNPFHCFIATTNIDDTYQTRLFDIITRDSCKSVIDMSSIPAFQPETVCGKSYITMYDDPYLNEVTRSNQKLLPVKKIVETDIKNRTSGAAQ
ncbi:hypothetical protein [Desulfobacula toluolica]|uniref:Uncharacterized protein related to glutamyl tRNA-reductase n=1 Tax=Desulfobacula toluolica (strain DSM 7467 / Tol2) TaxID=651182 RepID=K0NJL2_DESTT|nr:hypothetical protein [Desulfobacula toluolica]CCK79047.1 uncharacterized protein related to glutamyl tRNA-reductase [Desulfobacula toluolica Tol2]